MAAVPYGGETPLVNQDSRITVESPATTSVAAPLVKNGVYRLIGGVNAADASAYKILPAVAADTPSSTLLGIALHEQSQPNQPTGVLVLNPYGGMVVKLKYTGSPTLGQSIGVSAADVTKVVGIAWARGAGTIVKIDTVLTEVEVLFS